MHIQNDGIMQLHGCTALFLMSVSDR